MAAYPLQKEGGTNGVASKTYDMPLSERKRGLVTVRSNNLHVMHFARHSATVPAFVEYAN